MHWQTIADQTLDIRTMIRNSNFYVLFYVKTDITEMIQILALIEVPDQHMAFAYINFHNWQ